MNLQPITIANTTIHQDTHGRFSLNDLHKAAGEMPKHRPSEWQRNKQTQELIDEISSMGIPALVSINGGKARGTYGCRELVFAYATWISPAFFLKVIRTYDALMTAPAAVRPGQVEALRRERGLPATLTPEQYETECARLEALQSCLDATPITIMPEHYKQLKGEHMHVGKKTWLVADLIGVLEEYGIPREVAEDITGHNRNAIRQFAFLSRQRKGGAA